MDTNDLVERLEKFPQLKARIEEILSVAENPNQEIELADDAEDMLVVIGRQLNKAALQVWAENQVVQKSRQFEQRHGHAHRDEKKTPLA